MVDFFERQRVIETAMTVDGCQGVEVWAGDDEILVMATWKDRDAYRIWLEHPARNAGNDELNELLDTPITPEIHGGRYELALCEEHQQRDKE